MLVVPTKHERILIGRIENENEFAEFLGHTNVKSSHFLIKPNWASPHYGNYTDAKTLRLLFENLDGEKTVIESYSIARSRGTPPDKTINTEYRRWLQNQDNWFLQHTGISDLLKQYGVDYINITEEVWSGRTIDKETVKKIVENRYPKVKQEELYSYIPAKLYKLRGNVLISFAKIKGASPYCGFISLSTKNLSMGLIPDPEKFEKWHGKGNSKLPQSITDMLKVYSSLFNVVGINEGIYSMIELDSNGTYRCPAFPGERYNVWENLGIVLFGENTIILDAFSSHFIGVDPNDVQYLKHGAKIFGKWDRQMIETAEKLRKKYQESGIFI